MAPVAQSTVLDNKNDGPRPRFGSLAAWAKEHGEQEYAMYKKTETTPMSYEEWLASPQIASLYLWHATMDVWNEDTTSDEDSDDEVPEVVLPRQEMPVRPKPVTTNGHGMRPPIKSTASTPRPNSDEVPAESARRKRKPRKPYLSDELIVEDNTEDDKEGSTSLTVEDIPNPTPPAPTATAANGRRKSAGRKKKQFLSKATISADDEEEPASIDAVASAELFDSAAVETPAPLVQKKVPKPKGGKKMRRSFKSQETVAPDDDEDSAPAGVATPKNASALSPDGPGSGSLSSSRRGLRARTAAQQNPYQYNEKLFEDLLSGDGEQRPLRNTASPSKAPTTKLAEVSYPVEEEEADVEADVDNDEDVNDSVEVNADADADLDVDESTTILADEDVPSEEQSNRKGKAHYKGKGRAWKKTESDDDEDFKTLVRPKKVKLLAKQKLGRRKSTHNYAPKEEDRLAREAAVEAAMKAAEEAEQRRKPKKQPKSPKLVRKPRQKKTVTDPATGEEQKRRRRSRKPKISSEFVNDDDDDSDIDEEQEQDHALDPIVDEDDERAKEQEQQSNGVAKGPTVKSSTPKKPAKTKVKTRKSDQSNASKDANMADLDDEDDFSAGQKRTTPRKKTTSAIS
ncbi:hypothetical protein CC80DRAFT_535264 [Byssothecium circinans]|uniref:Uncharacterized protein n=1 Tax=Byssothecium circinans TaxID=147558 RepID=A0A6A5TVH0_9PLEO|nr:hypothetical protein CC80DRAFT_535264 [Byssothecium circinans]